MAHNGDPMPDKEEARRPDARQLRSDRALRAALLTLIARQPVDKVTVRDIVAEAGIGYATFFRHYPSKDALLEAVIGEEVGAMMEASSPYLNPTETRVTCLAVANHVDARREIWAAMLAGAPGEVRRQMASRAASHVGATNLSSDWLPLDLGVRFGVITTIEILDWWLQDAPDCPADEVAELLDRLLITPTVGSPRKR